jgi:hypothetical protein
VRTLTTILIAALLLMLAGCGPRSVTTANDPDSQAVMDALVTKIFGQWNADALASVADPSVYTKERMDRVRAFFHELSGSLGPMVSAGKAKGVTVITGTGQDQVKNASYEADVVFKKGTATIHIDAAKKQGKWLVENASVQPSHHLKVH